MTNTSRRKLSTQQLDRRIALLKRSIALKQAKAVRDGTLTRAQLDQHNAQFDETYQAEPIGIGSDIEWDGNTYRVAAHTADEVIVSKVNRGPSTGA